MVPEVTLFFGNEDSDTDYRRKDMPLPSSTRQGQLCKSNIQNHQRQMLSQNNLGARNGQPQRTEKPRPVKTRNLKVSNHEVHFQHSPSIEESPYPNQSSMGTQGQTTPAQPPPYVSQNIRPPSGGPFTGGQPPPQFQHLPHSSAFTHHVVNGAPRGAVSSAMVNQHGLRLHQQPQQSAAPSQFYPQGQPSSTCMSNQHPPQQINQGFTNNYVMPGQLFSSHPQMQTQPVPAYLQHLTQQQWMYNQVSNAGVFTHPAPSNPATQTGSTSSQNSRQHSRDQQSKQTPDNHFDNLESRVPQSQQIIQNTEKQRTRQHNAQVDQSGRSSDDSGLSITPEKLSLSPKTKGSKAPVLSNSPVKSLDTPGLQSGKYNWDQVPPEIYQLLMQQDSQLKQLQSQIEQLLQNQSQSTSSVNIPTEECDSKKEVEKCSIAINTTMFFPGESDERNPSRQSVSQQTSPHKACHAVPAALQCGATDSSQSTNPSCHSTNPSCHSEGDALTPAEIRHQGRIQLNSTEHDFDVDVSQGDLVSVMNDVRLNDKTVDSIQSDMIVDLPSYQSSPSRYVSCCQK